MSWLSSVHGFQIKTVPRVRWLYILRMAESVKKRVPVGHTSSENWMEDKLRLNKKQFMVLLKKVKPHIVRRMAERFDPFSTLLEVLKFLATGEGENPSFKSILVVLCGALEAEYFPNVSF